jgi:hypothetical protein
VLTGSLFVPDDPSPISKIFRDGKLVVLITGVKMPRPGDLNFVAVRIADYIGSA